MNDLQFIEMRQKASEKFNFETLPIEFVANFIHNSLSFETPSLKYSDVLKVLKEEQVDLKEERVVAIQNNFKALSFVADLAYKQKALDENLLKDTHALLMGEDAIGGLYRNVDISIKGSMHTPPSHIKVYDRMKKYFVSLSSSNNLIEKIAFSLVQLDKIHPFLDGNGKLARIVLNYHLLYNKISPVVFPVEEKQTYFKCIEIFKVEKSIDSFVEFLKELLEK